MLKPSREGAVDSVFFRIYSTDGHEDVGCGFMAK